MRWHQERRTSTIRRATRSLLDPPGFRNSAYQTCTCVPHKWHTHESHTRQGRDAEVRCMGRKGVLEMWYRDRVLQGTFPFVSGGWWCSREHRRAVEKEIQQATTQHSDSSMLANVEGKNVRRANVGGQTWLTLPRIRQPVILLRDGISNIGVFPIHPAYPVYVCTCVRSCV